MPSRYLNSLNQIERMNLEKSLLETQNGVCFICGEPMDLKLHAGNLDIDHIEPMAIGGKDEPNNFGLTHSTCNRSKQASDLRVARILHKFGDIRDKYSDKGPNHPNLSDVFQEYGGEKYHLPLKISNGEVSYSFPELR